MKHLIHLFFTLSLASLLVGCGGSSSSDDDDKKETATATVYTGKTTPATLSAANSKPLGVASTEASKTASSAEVISSFKTSASSDVDVDALVKKTVQDAVSFASEEVPDVCSSGSLTIDGIDPAADPYGYLDLTIVYSNCVFSELTPAVTVDGTARFTGFLLGDFTLAYTDFTVSYDGKTETINMTIECISSTCSMSSDFTSTDGITYRVENLVISGDNFSGYFISGKVYHPDHGYVEITTTSAIFFSACTKGNPSSGEIEFTDTVSTVTVSYIDCTSYSVTFDDGVNPAVTTPYTW